MTLIRGDSVTPRPIRWLWQGWLAAGKFHVVGGQPGTGKTTIALDFAAIVSSGGRWPDGSRAEAGNVLIWSGEDDAEDVLAPRLQAMGADMTRIYFVGDVCRGVTLPRSTLQLTCRHLSARVRASAARDYSSLTLWCLR